MDVVIPFLFLIIICTFSTIFNLTCVFFSVITTRNGLQKSYVNIWVQICHQGREFCIIGSVKQLLCCVLHIYSGLKQDLCHAEKICIASYYIQFSNNIKMYNHNIKKDHFLARAFGILGLVLIL